MARILFVSAPLPGHLDWGGFLKTARASREAGHAVQWVSGEPVRGMVEGAGVDFQAVARTGWRWPPPPMPEGLPAEEREALRYRRALDTWLTEDLVREAAPGLVEAAEAFEPDVIASDPFLAGAAFAAEVVGVPFAVCGWPAVPPQEEGKLLPVQRELGADGHARVRRLCEAFGVEGVNWGGGAVPVIQSPELHVSYFSAGWHKGEPNFLPQTAFVGGTAEPPRGEAPAWLADLPEAPAVFITLGSVFTEDLGFFTHAAHAAAANGAVPIVVLGKPLAREDKEDLKRNLPGGTRLLQWVDYDHVLPRCSLAIHHGGMGTTHAAIVQGLPQIIVPHAADQRGQARRAAVAKVGLHLSTQDVVGGRLPDAVKAMLTDGRVAEAAAGLREAFAALGGAERAAELLVGLTSGSS